jgi:excisionase family DNA binding protein
MSTTSPQQPIEPLLLNVDEAAHLLGLKAKTVYEYSAAGIIPSVKVGRLRRFRRAELEPGPTPRAPRTPRSDGCHRLR